MFRDESRRRRFPLPVRLSPVTDETVKVSALDLSTRAEAALAQLAHPARAGRYPEATRDRLMTALEVARAATSEVTRVIDTSPGPSTRFREDAHTG